MIPFAEANEAENGVRFTRERSLVRNQARHSHAGYCASDLAGRTRARKLGEDKLGVPYKLFYRLGFHPWEDLAQHPPFAETLTELFEREERGREPPYGAALDLGCGSAVWGVKLAARGWQVTGIDLVEKSLERARERVQETGVEMRVVQGDVTDLGGADLGSDYRLVLDTGTFHGLPADQRAAMGREVSAIAADDATVILDVFAPRRRGPLPHGASQRDVESAFPDWEITDIEVADTDPDPIAKLFKFDERFYRLVRR